MVPILIVTVVVDVATAGLGRARDSMGIDVMVEVRRLTLCLDSYRQPLDFNNINNHSSNEKIRIIFQGSQRMLSIQSFSHLANDTFYTKFNEQSKAGKMLGGGIALVYAFTAYFVHDQYKAEIDEFWLLLFCCMVQRFASCSGYGRV
ncbi:hypothetical protein V6N12_025608 [Hibiscus sabdariffa]|uniref:Uncharacterized protein n=1 Tax=Hibiscus sabdariffa TaxID=183260 RepID=A0ABR2CIY2_9ROSI